VTVTYRPATADDGEQIRWALYTALAWDPERDLPPPEVTLEHPEAARYHRDWGRAGDFGVIAAEAGAVVGVAYCRLFTEDDHGYGFVDEATPEVAIGIRSDLRGRGLGTELLTRLAEAARASGFERLSLSVAAANPARRLYTRLGYRTVSVDGDGVRMLVDLAE
jgi:ribosomal protein S18 acetylase RimI-like enzyme